MTKLSYLLAAVAAVAIVSPTLAQDMPKTGAAISQGTEPAGVVKRDERRMQDGRGEMRKEGGHEQGRMEVRGERRWHRSHAERIVVVHRHHHHEM